jgi:prepilin-type N-terminal cleavage/methylation domain-containing protein
VSGPRHRAAERGMTLVELMIAVIILGIVVGAAFSVSFSIMNSYREHRRGMGVERSARGAMAVLVDAVRNASPGVPNGQIVDLVGCETTWRGIRVVNGADAPDAIDLIYAKGGVTTSLRAPFDQNSNTIVVEDGSLLAPNDQILVTDFVTGHLVTVQAVTQVPPDFNLTLTSTPNAACGTPPAPFSYPLRATVIRAQRARFSVGGASPTLMLDPDGAIGPLLPEAVAEGIEDLQIAIGVDRDGNGLIEENVTAGDADDWVFNHPADTLLPDIGVTPYRAIRLTVLAVSTNETTAVASSLRPAAEDRAAATTPDNLRRRSLSTIVEIRNLEGSP